MYAFVFRNLILATVFATGTSLAWYFLVNKRRKDNYAAFYQVSASCASRNQSKLTKQSGRIRSRERVQFFIRNVSYRVFCSIFWKKQMFSYARYHSSSLLQLLCSKKFYNKILFEDSYTDQKICQISYKIGLGTASR
jgi:hypothetical protein